jgi:hypothetical protein
MKKIILILFITAFFGCKSKKVDTNPTAVAMEKTVNKPVEKTIRKTIEKTVELKIVKLVLSEVDSNQKDKAYELGKRILLTCNTSRFKAFNESEATQSVINNITLEKLSQTCLKYRQWYGTFKDLQLVEIFKNNTDKTTIFRYKALYSKKVANKELRVYMNEENKVSAIKTLDWTAAYDNQ